MISLSFKQTSQEFMVRIAATIVFKSLLRAGYPKVLLCTLTEKTAIWFLPQVPLQNLLDRS